MKVRSWYGLTGEIEVEHQFWHLVRISGVPLGHPPVINNLLRRGLGREERLELSFLHEYGHLQTAPLAFAHLVWLIRCHRRGRKHARSTATTLLAVAVAHQGIWEMLSEGYVLFCNRRPRRTTHGLWSALLFWTTVTGLGIGLSLWISKSGRDTVTRS